MLSKLREVLLSRHAPPEVEPRDEDIRLATAALLVEMARADFHARPEELLASRRLLADYFAVSEAEAEALVEEAGRAVDRSVSLRDFTAPLHRNLDITVKHRIIAMLWAVALEDRGLDRHEELLIARLAELLYIPRTDVIRLRNEALARR